MSNLQFNLDAAAEKKNFEHYWEKCVGSCHGYTALRADYREQLKKAKEDIGFRYVRFHGILNDDMSVVREITPGNYEYNFVNIDNIIDFLLDIGMKPFMEISGETFQKALKAMESCERIICTAVPVGSCNKRLGELIDAAKKSGKTEFV